MKRIKSKRELSNCVMEEKGDRISQLPERILEQILSFLHLKHAVQTSVLSKGWKTSWSSLPDLNFSFRNLADLSRVNIWNSWDVDGFMPQFILFVIQYLSQRDGSSRVGKFRLCSDLTSTDSKFVEQCVEYAVSHGAQEIDLDVLCRPTPVKFSGEFIASKSLKILKLKQYKNSLVVPNPFILPNLTTLQLECFQFRDDDLYSFSKEPFSGLPNLEQLTLHRCEVDDLIISGSKLKILEISFTAMFSTCEKKIRQISAPMLTSLRYEGYISLVCPVIDLPCLEEVYFHHYAVLQAPFTDGIAKKMPWNLTRMLRQLGNAKFITVTMETIEVLTMDPDLLEQNTSPFPQMKHLILKKNPSDSDSTVPDNIMNYLTKGTLHGSSLVVQSLISDYN